MAERLNLFFETTPALQDFAADQRQHTQEQRQARAENIRAVKHLAELTSREACMANGRPTTGDVVLDKLAAATVPMLHDASSSTQAGGATSPRAKLSKARRQRKAGTVALRCLGQLSRSMNSETNSQSFFPSCVSEQTAINLADRNLSPEDIYKTTRACVANPAITSLDLSGSRITKHAFDLVLRALRDIPEIIDVDSANLAVMNHEHRDVPAKYKERLKEQLQLNRARQRRKVTSTAHRQTYREGVTQAQLYRSLQAYVSDDEAAKREAILKEAAQHAVLLHRAHTTGHAAIEERLLRRSREVERRRRVNRLFTVEADHRIEIEAHWIRVWIPLTERLETRVRATLVAEKLAMVQEVRAAANEDKKETRQLMNRRMEKEGGDRDALQELEASCRRSIEVAGDKVRGVLKQQEIKVRKYAHERYIRRMDLIRLEENRFNRGKIVHDEGEARLWIQKRWEIAELQKTTELERQRQVIVVAEGAQRDVVSTAEERAAGVLHRVVVMCLSMRRLLEERVVLTEDRRSLVSCPPNLDMKVADTEPQKYITRQHESLRTDPAELSLDPTSTVSVAIPPNWKQSVSALLHSLRRNSTELLEKRKALSEELDALPTTNPEVLAMLTHCIGDIVSCCTEQKEAEETRGMDVAKVAHRKGLILGGTVVFRVVPSDGFSASSYTQERLSLSSFWGLTSEESVQPKVDIEYGANSEQPIYPAGATPAVLSIAIPPHATASDVEDVIRACVYTTKHPMLVGSLARHIRVTTRLCFVNVTDETDPFLSAEEDTVCETKPCSVLSVETTYRRSLVLCCPYLWVQNDCKPLTFTEGDSMEKVAVAPDIVVAPQPRICHQNGIVVVESGGTPFTDARLVLEFTAGFTSDDIFTFKSGTDMLYEDGKHFVFRGVTVGEIVEGALAKSVQDSNFQFDFNSYRIVIALTNAGADAVKRIITRVRYFNVSMDPVEGPRTVTISLTDGSGCVASVCTQVVVQAVDNPATLTVPLPRKYYHSIYTNQSVPVHLRSYLKIKDFFPYHDAVVEDVDTDNFCGGHLVMSVNSNYQKGDLLGFPEACFEGRGFHNIRLLPACFEEPEHDFGTGDGYENLWDVLHDGLRVGVLGFYDTLERRGPAEDEDIHEMSIPPSPRGVPRLSSTGLAMSLGRRPSQRRLLSRLPSQQFHGFMGRREKIVYRYNLLNSPQEGRSGRHVCMQFSLKGAASMDAVRDIIKTICFLPIIKPAEFNRSIELEVQTGITVGKTDSFGKVASVKTDLIDAALFHPSLKTTVHVRVTLPLFTLVGKSSLLRYTEGAGALRIASFETSNDLMTDGYEGGYVRVEFAEGFCQDDMIGFREEGFLLKQRDVVDSQLPFAVLVAHSDRFEEEKTGRKGGKRAVDDEEELKTLQSFRFNKSGSPVYRSPQTRMRLPQTSRCTVSEVFCESKFIGIMTACKEALQISFVRPAKAEKEKFVARKEISAILRAITYSNTSKDPQSLSKVLRVNVSDGSPLASQAIVEVQIQPVDDVTDILLKNDRLRYRPCDDDAAMPFLISPLGEADIYDPDTEYFDGGFISAEITSGASKGDSLGILTADQQRAQIAAAPQMKQVYAAMCSRPPPRPVRTLTDPSQFVFDVAEEGKKIVAVNGSFTCNVAYPLTKNCKDSHDVKVTFPMEAKQAASLDVVMYILNCFTFGSTMKEKLREGARTVLLKVGDRHNPQHGKAKLTVDVRLPFLYQPHIPLSFVPGVVLPIAQKLSINHSDSLGLIVSGFCQMELIDGMEGDALMLNLREGGFTVKEGLLYCKNVFLAVYSASPTRIRLEFNQNTKASGKHLLAVFKQAVCKFGAMADVTRVCRFSGTYDRPDRVNTEDLIMVCKE